MRGLVGSHTCVALLQAGHEVVVVDSLENSSAKAIAAVAAITSKSLHLEVADCRDTRKLEHIFQEVQPTVVLHFAGLKSGCGIGRKIRCAITVII